jgi:hypothetical protein
VFNVISIPKKLWKKTLDIVFVLSSLVKLWARLNNNSWKLLATTQYFLHCATMGFTTAVESIMKSMRSKFYALA